MFRKSVQHVIKIHSSSRYKPLKRERGGNYEGGEIEREGEDSGGKAFLCGELCFWRPYVDN